MISIIIPNYNGCEYLRGCIDSIYNYAEVTIEIIIIDNGSKDSTYEWISKEYPNILFKKLNKNYGFSKAVNEGIKLAQGKYVILLNNDTLLCEGFIEELVKAIDKDEKIFSACSQMIQYHDREKIDDAGDEYTILGWAYKRGDGQLVDSYIKTEQVFSCCAGAAIYRKNIFEEIGYFDENFFAYMEDVDISYRARIYGYKNIYCPKAKVYHIGSATSGSKYNAFKVKLAARNNIYVPYKNMPLLQLVMNMPFLVIGYLTKYLFFLRKGWGREYREGFREGLRGFYKIDRTPFKSKNIINYICIEFLLIKNIFKYIITKLFKIK